MKVLLSIKEDYASQIFSGKKKFEFRKIIFRKDITTVVVYVTKPVGKVIGEFKIGDVICDSPENIWKRTKQVAGVNESFFFSYFAGRNIGYAIEVSETILYDEAIDLHNIENSNIKRPPQSFQYL